MKKLLFFTVLLALSLPGLVRAATLTVTSTADSGPGSLRAILATSSTDGDGDVITFDPTVFATRQTIFVTGSILLANAGVTLQGPGAGLILDGSCCSATSIAWWCWRTC